MSFPRRERELAEHAFIGPHGILSENSLGRAAPEEECRIRTCFQRDIDRITHSKSFRRLKHKTQVFLQPEGDHYRTRLTHTLEVSRLARTVAAGHRNWSRQGNSAKKQQRQRENMRKTSVVCWKNAVGNGNWPRRSAGRSTILSGGSS